MAQVFIKETFDGIKAVEINGRTYVNTTPHDINFLVGGDVVTVPPSGVVINAKPAEVITHREDDITFVKTVFEGTREGDDNIEDLQFRFPGCLIIGSIIAAQAYPGRVLAMIPAPGFERVPPNQKRMRADKFTVF